MPKTIILEITHSDGDAGFLRTLPGRLPARCEYIGTYHKRFILCREFSGGRYVYYAVDELTGKFSRICESSFAMTAEAIARNSGQALVNAIKYTGVFNRARISATQNPAFLMRWVNGPM